MLSGKGSFITSPKSEKNFCKPVNDAGEGEGEAIEPPSCMSFSSKEGEAIEPPSCMSFSSKEGEAIEPPPCMSFSSKEKEILHFDNNSLEAIFSSLLTEPESSLIFNRAEYIS
jgi:hypothetical protein